MNRICLQGAVRSFTAINRTVVLKSCRQFGSHDGKPVYSGKSPATGPHGSSTKSAFTKTPDDFVREVKSRNESLSTEKKSVPPPSSATDSQINKSKVVETKTSAQTSKGRNRPPFPSKSQSANTHPRSAGAKPSGVKPAGAKPAGAKPAGAKPVGKSASHGSPKESYSSDDLFMKEYEKLSAMEKSLFGNTEVNQEELNRVAHAAAARKGQKEVEVMGSMEMPELHRMPSKSGTVAPTFGSFEEDFNKVLGKNKMNLDMFSEDDQNTIKRFSELVKGNPQLANVTADALLGQIDMADDEKKILREKLGADPNATENDSAFNIGDFIKKDPKYDEFVHKLDGMLGEDPSLSNEFSSWMEQIQGQFGSDLSKMKDFSEADFEKVITPPDKLKKVLDDLTPIFEELDGSLSEMKKTKIGVHEQKEDGTTQSVLKPNKFSKKAVEEKVDIHDNDIAAVVSEVPDDQVTDPVENLVIHDISQQN